MLSKRKNNTFRLNLLVLAVTLVLTIGLIEFTSSKMLVKGDNVKGGSSIIRLHHNELGYVSIPGAQNATVEVGGKLCYNVTYHIDNYGRRITEAQYDPLDSHILFFGDSMTFGEGLQDNQTLPYYIAAKLTNTSVYNYAVPGYSPAQMLAKLESGSLNEEINSSGIAIYVMIEAHIERVAASTRTPWLYDSPYYELEDGVPIRHKFFRDGRPIRTALYNMFIELKAESAFLQLIDAGIPHRPGKKDVEKTAAIIAQSSKIYEKEFNGKFIVLMHPNWNITKVGDDSNYDEIMAELKKHNLTIIDYSNVRNTKENTLGCDPHSNAQFNTEIAELLTQDLQGK